MLNFLKNIPFPNLKYVSSHQYVNTLLNTIQLFNIFIDIIIVTLVVAVGGYAMQYWESLIHRQPVWEKYCAIFMDCWCALTWIRLLTGIENNHPSLAHIMLVHLLGNMDTKVVERKVMLSISKLPVNTSRKLKMMWSYMLANHLMP